MLVDQSRLLIVNRYQFNDDTTTYLTECEACQELVGENKELNELDRLIDFLTLFENQHISMVYGCHEWILALKMSNEAND